MTNVKQNILFAGLPRRRRLAGIVTIGLWLGIVVAFVTDAVPTHSSVDWLYGVEARRDAHARALALRAAAEQPPAARRAARTAPPSTTDRDHRAIPMVKVAAIPSHTPVFACQLP
ncbi:MAG TPA: hypothetical protein VLC54_06270 [Anaeromyxobacter sp.]|nr:hypothetical protein [Anaeromyxobacter sp.]